MLYILYINFDDKIKEYVLPLNENGHYLLDVSVCAGRKCSLLLDKTSGKWRIRSNDYTILEKSDETGIMLEDNMTLSAYIKKTTVRFAILVRIMSEENAIFGKYLLKNKIIAGSSVGSDILIDNELISHRHFYIEKKGRKYLLTDQSLNGTWLNGKKIEKGNPVELNRFDSVYIPGTTIIFLGNICAFRKLNNISTALEPADDIFSKNTEPAEYDEDQYFKAPAALPSPVMLDVQVQTVNIENRKQKDMMQISMTALISSSVLTAAYSFSHEKSCSSTELGLAFVTLTAVMSASMVMLRSLHRRRILKNTENRISDEKIQELVSKEQKINEVQNQFREYLWDRYYTQESVLSHVSLKSSEIWRIKPDEDDFLKICIGKTCGDFRKMMELPENPCTETNVLYDRYSKITDVPMLLDLKNEKVIGLYGEQKNTAGLLRSIVLRTTFSFSSSAVRVILFATETQRESFDFFRWLPHAFQGVNSQRLISFDEKSRKNVLFFLVSELSMRLEKLREDKNITFAPHLIVFCTNDEIFRNEAVEKYLSLEEDLGVTFVTVYEDRTRIPHNCRIRISCDDGITVRNTGRTEQIKAELESVPADTAEWFSRRLLELGDSFLRNGTLPDGLSFYECCGVSSADDFEILENYRSFSTADEIKACIGVRSSGEKFILDLHEKKHGPHGLVAGTTGSGKSEILRTLVLSLALRYTPDELTFVFIDYKGGGMADVFENLSHTAGIVTNLTDSLENGINLARRAVISLKSEITRRQKIFREQKISSADTYIRLFKEGKVKEPLPHIIIIVDEFAELKSEQPEFISQLISISRIGRSLGMHLILATQKPAGVIDDEIWGNARFRLCLKVQDKTDSIEMLRRPEAQTLTATGRAYVQIGNNEIFDMIQTGYTGAPDVQSSTRSAVMIDDEGQPAVVRFSADTDKKSESQLGVLLRKISDVCEKNNIRKAGRLWLPPLKRVIEYDEIRSIVPDKSGTEISLTAGMLDDPENQKEMPYELVLSETGNILTAGDAGSGKTTFMQTLVFSASEKYASDRLMISVFDFSGGLYEVFGKLPHCSDIYSCPDEYVMSSFLEKTKKEIDIRKHRFSELGTFDFREYLETEQIFKTWIVFFDGYYNFKEAFSDLEDEFSNIVRECTKYGIYFIVSVRQLADMKFRTRQNFSTCIPFRLSDRTEYTELFGVGAEYDISKIPGRAPVKYLGKILEFQSAVCFCGTGREKNEYLSAFFDKKYACADREKHVSDAAASGQETFCKLYRASERAAFETEIHDRAGCGETIIYWSGTSGKIKKEYQKTYYGTQGIFELLLELKDEFRKRLEEKRNRGICSAGKMTVAIDDFEDFLKRVYSENEEEDMASAAEMYFKKGSGLNIYFTAYDKNENSCSQQKAYRYFISYTSGE